MVSMHTVVLGPRPAELEALIARRKQHGVDLFDEVWEGSYHMVPAAHPSHGYVDRQLAIALDPYASRAGLIGTGPFNLGVTDNYRVPDGGFHRALPRAVWVATAAVVVEVVSPDDETYAKFGFYFDHGVDELLIADPSERSVSCWVRGLDGFQRASASELLAVEANTLAGLISWP
jgi:Uma2 family endonuclease